MGGLIQNPSAPALKLVSPFQHKIIYSYLFLLAYIALLFPWCLHPAPLSYIDAAQSCPPFGSLLLGYGNQALLSYHYKSAYFLLCKHGQPFFQFVFLIHGQLNYTQCFKWRLDWVWGSSTGAVQTLMEMTHLINPGITFDLENLCTSSQSIFVLLLGLTLFIQ